MAAGPQCRNSDRLASDDVFDGVVPGPVDSVLEFPSGNALRTIEVSAGGKAHEVIVERVCHDVGGEHERVQLSCDMQFPEKTGVQGEWGVGLKRDLAFDAGFGLRVPGFHPARRTTDVAGSVDGIVIALCHLGVELIEHQIDPLASGVLTECVQLESETEHQMVFNCRLAGTILNPDRGPASGFGLGDHILL